MDEDESFYEDKMEEQMTDGDTELKHSAAMFLLRTREEYKVTQVALNEIVHGVQGLWKDFIQNLKVLMAVAT